MLDSRKPSGVNPHGGTRATGPRMGRFTRAQLGAVLHDLNRSWTAESPAMIRADGASVRNRDERPAPEDRVGLANETEFDRHLFAWIEAMQAAVRRGEGTACIGAVKSSLVDLPPGRAS